MLSVLQSIPIDVVEIIIVKSKDYELFETLKKVLVKLNEPSRVSRINNKLTKVILTRVNIDKFLYESRLNGKKHGEYNKPCIIYIDGESAWYKYDELYRDDDLPSRCSNRGSRFWYIDNEKCRENGNPAYIINNGNQCWYVKGSLERDNLLPAWIDLSGSKHVHKYSSIRIFGYINEKFV